MSVLDDRLDRIQGQRAQGRKARAKAELPVLSLVGYTNAGKSTLFNRLTDAGVYQADQLFATLDPTVRRLSLPDGGRVLLADTVGFVGRLPHELVAAFRSTLEETRGAALLLHVVEASAPHRARLIGDVEQVLAEIGSDGIPRLEVYNKLDLMDGEAPRIENDDAGQPSRVWISAATGAGLDLLLRAIAERLAGERVHCCLQLAPGEGRLRARLFEHARVLSEEGLPAGGWRLEVEVDAQDWQRLMGRARQGGRAAASA
jgi:GTP-binding protein HflX